MFSLHCSHVTDRARWFSDHTICIDTSPSWVTFEVTKIPSTAVSRVKKLVLVKKPRYMAR